MSRRFMALLVVLASSAAFAAPQQDSAGGVWKDAFADFTGLSFRQQVAMSGYGGITVDPGLQSWSQPYSSTIFSEAFTSSRSSGSRGIVAYNPGRANEYLKLWRNRWAPAETMGIGQVCDTGNEKTDCFLNPYLTKVILNGDAQLGIIDGIPGEKNRGAGAIWGGSFKFINTTLLYEFAPYVLPTPLTSYLHAIKAAGLPLLFGATESRLFPGVDYDVTVLAAIDNGPEGAVSYVDYMTLLVVDRSTGLPFATHTINEGDFLAHVVNKDIVYKDFTPISAHLTGLPTAVWDFQVWPAIPSGTHNHCTALGPIFVSATNGNYKSPVLDTLSPNTLWVKISWNIDQCTNYSDSGPTAVCDYMSGTGCKAPAAAAAIAPVQIDYSVDSAEPYSGTATTWEIKHYDWQAPADQNRPLEDYTVMNSSTLMSDGTGAGPLHGRYFQYRLNMFGRGSAGALEPTLAPSAMHPANPSAYFGGFSPTVRRIAVNYYVCAARVVSDLITPTSIKQWGKLSYKSYLPTTGASVVVDVLSENENVLKAGVNPGDSISDLDPYVYPRLKLRATLTSDPADINQRPILESWQVDWAPNPELLTLDRNGFRPDRGETVNAQVRVDRPGRVIVRVHDASGQLIKMLLDGDQPARATLIVWNGRNERGEKVAPGVYFMSAGVPGAGKVKRVAVLR